MAPQLLQSLSCHVCLAFWKPIFVHDIIVSFTQPLRHIYGAKGSLKSYKTLFLIDETGSLFSFTICENMNKRNQEILGINQQTKKTLSFTHEINSSLKKIHFLNKNSICFKKKLLLLQMDDDGSVIVLAKPFSPPVLKSWTQGRENSYNQTSITRRKTSHLSLWSLLYHCLV